MVANKDWMRSSAGWWHGGMVAQEGLDVMQLYYISSCVVVREEGVNGLLGIVYGVMVIRVGRWWMVHFSEAC